MKKIFVLFTCIILLLIYVPTTTSENINNGIGPELETYILTGLDIWVIKIHVKNIGDTTAHNVTLSQVTISGTVIINFQQSTLWSVDLAPGEWTFLDPNSMIIGFGKFTITMTVECEEGASSTSSVTGLIFGPLFFIP